MTLAAYLFVKEMKEDENAELNSEQLLEYQQRADKVEQALNFIIYWLKENRIENEDAVSVLVYDAGKRFYGTDKTQLKDFFRDVYLVLFQKTQGVRIPSYICLLGIDDFCNMVEKILKDPFGINTLI